MYFIDDDGAEYVNFIDDDDGGKYVDFIDDDGGEYVNHLVAPEMKLNRK